MRISDWSSDVCSSDLAKLAKTDAEIDKLRAETAKILSSIGLDVRKQDLDEYETAAAQQDKAIDRTIAVQNRSEERQQQLLQSNSGGRSEEHTTELQSLMSISYAVSGM